MTSPALGVNWTFKDTKSEEAEIEADDCIINVKLTAVFSTPKSITRPNGNKRRKNEFVATKQEASVLYSLAISNDPMGEPFEIEYDRLLPVAKINHWLESHELDQYLGEVIQTISALQNNLTQPSQ